MDSKLHTSFFRRDVLKVAPELLGKILVRRFADGKTAKFKITETEAYRGTQDLACHSSKGRTPRTEIMFHSGGVVYVYLIYGMYWMLNFVAGEENDASAVLIRGVESFPGPGRVGKALQLDKSFYGENLATSNRIWVENAPIVSSFTTTPRIGIAYSGKPWTTHNWRFLTEK